MTRLPAGSRDLVMPSATMAESHSTGAPSASACRAARPTPGDQARSAGRSVIPQAWIIRTTAGSRSAGTALRSASALMIANDSR